MKDFQTEENLNMGSLTLKLDLARMLLSKGFSKEKVRAIMNFLRFYVRLKGDKDVIFERQLEAITGKPTQWESKN